MKAIAKNIRISPKKANLVAGLVRNTNALKALNILKFTPKKGAKILYKVLHSAIANAENNFKQDKDSLIVKEIVVTEGPTMKRSVPVSRGRVHPILKRTSHITVQVGVSEEKAKSEVKTAPKPKPEKKEAPKKEEPKKTTT
jgi:large subunit ribosomal protein L22